MSFCHENLERKFVLKLESFIDVLANLKGSCHKSEKRSFVVVINEAAVVANCVDELVVVVLAIAHKNLSSRNETMYSSTAPIKENLLNLQPLGSP